MSVYQLNKLCHRLYHDLAFREAVKADPANAIADWPLSDAERQALLAGDIKRLYEWGTHPFLLGHITRWDLFGVTPAIYAERIKDARDPADELYDCSAVSERTEKVRHAMPGIDESRQFVPLKIAVLTVSDTRNLADDKSGATLAERIEKAGHAVAARAIVTDDVEKIRVQMRTWIADRGIDIIISTGGTGFTGRDVTPEAVEPLFEKRMDGFSTLFHMVSAPKIGSSTIQSRATAGVANATFIFCLPGSPGACRDAWDEILVHQLNYRYRPCNFVELMPRLDEHLRRPKAKGATA